MNRDEAYQAMRNGKKLTHKYFTSDEYIHIVDGCIVNENGRYSGYDFFYTDFMTDGFSIYQGDKK
ncbi:hypothetical protein [Flyfo podovirus Tbat2_2]|nr:hypothetical protein [Flyfo podovirus Tbat2_2]